MSAIANTITQTVALEEEINATVNLSKRTLYDIVNLRGARAEYLVSNDEIIDHGLRAWLTEEKLIALLLVFKQPNESTAIEEFEIKYAYVNSAQTSKPDRTAIEALMMRLEALPPDAAYTIYAYLQPGYTAVDGWQPGEKPPVKADIEEIITGWQYGCRGATVYYRGSSLKK